MKIAILCDGDVRLTVNDGAFMCPDSFRQSVEHLHNHHSGENGCNYVEKW